MKTHSVTVDALASQCLCKPRDARRYLQRRHSATFREGAFWLTVEQYSVAYDFLRRRGAVYGARAANSAGAASLAKSDTETHSRRER
jgi:hypothetical protein